MPQVEVSTPSPPDQETTEEIPGSAQALATSAAPAPAVTSAGDWTTFLLFLTGAHLLIDTVAAFIQPLWPSLQAQYALGPTEVFWILSGYQIVTSGGQLVFGYLADQGRGRWLLWAGPATAVVCLSCLGLTQSAWLGTTLLLLGGLGVAAFHPEAAATAGACSPGRRSRAVSLFSLGGYLGQGIGPYYSGWITDHFGLSGLAWSLTWGLSLLCLFALGLRFAPPAPRRAAANAPWIPSSFRGKGFAIARMTCVGTLRALAVIGVPIVISFLLKDEGSRNEDIGIVQSIFMASIGFGGLICAVRVPREIERTVLAWVPVAVAPVLLLMPLAREQTLWGLAAVAGTMLGVTLPVLVSYGQHLLPDGQRLASSLTMGVCFGLGGLIIAGSMSVLQPLQAMGWMFALFAVASVLSSLVSLTLPDLNSSHENLAHASGSRKS